MGISLSSPNKTKIQPDVPLLAIRVQGKFIINLKIIIMRNSDPFAPWNNPMYKDDPFAPHNDTPRSDDPFAPWNDPLGDADDLSNDDKSYYGK